MKVDVDSYFFSACSVELNLAPSLDGEAMPHKRTR